MCWWSVNKLTNERFCNFLGTDSSLLFFVDILRYCVVETKQGAENVSWKILGIGGFCRGLWIIVQKYLLILSGFREFMLRGLGADIWSFDFQCSVDRILVHVNSSPRQSSQFADFNVLSSLFLITCDFGTWLQLAFNFLYRNLITFTYNLGQNILRKN